MKKPLLKTALFLSATAALFFISYSCSKQKLTSAEEPAATETTASVNTAPQGLNPFKKTIGAPVDATLGRQWISNFNKASQSSGISYVIQSEGLQTILSNPACIGICMYYALDAEKQVHILPIGVNESGRLMKSEKINTQKGLIDWDTAQKWIANDPGVIDARFFGKNTFDRLCSDKSCQAIRATFATDDKRNPQLLLSNAAIASEKLVNYEDNSCPCPPICPLISEQTF